jgi:uncharacterized paraquat-inducible protein A
MGWDDEDDDTISCPECTSSVYYDAEQCPKCGHFLIGSSRSGIATHWKVIAILILILFALGMMQI